MKAYLHADITQVRTPGTGEDGYTAVTQFVIITGTGGQEKRIARTEQPSIDSALRNVHTAAILSGAESYTIKVVRAMEAQ